MIWCLIPARKGSTGVKDKNIRLLPDGSTCLGRAVAMAAKFTGAQNIVISTDYSWAELPPVSAVYVRQPSLCANGGGSMLALMIHAMLEVGAAADDVVLLLQPTSPFRSVDTGRKVLDAVRGIIYYDPTKDAPSSPPQLCDSACSVMPYPTTWQWHPRYAVGADGSWNPPKRRQELGPAYRPDGGYYATTIRQLVTGSWGRMATVVSGPDESLTIDTPEDWATAERRIAEGGETR